MTTSQPPTRPLPAKTNPLMLPSATPSYNSLVSSRRLGQTKVPTPTYCHLPSPLPPDIFTSFRSTPSTTNLLRRLPDNLISATCLFRAVFPYANADEKIREFRHLRGIWKSEYDEETGDVWVPAKQGIRLAEEYGVERWVVALLDGREVERIPHEVIDLTLDDSDEEDIEREREQSENDEAEPRRHREAREQEEQEGQGGERRRDAREESPGLQAHLQGGPMRMAVMR